MKKNFTILAIDTSCDETSAAVTVDDKVVANVVSSQVELHRKYGGVVPILAQRAHRERIDAVIQEAVKRAKANLGQSLLENIDAVAVTVGPGLAPALEVGIKKAKELVQRYNKPLIVVNHMEAHLLSAFAKNSKGKNSIVGDQLSAISFPLLGLLISGGHTELVLMQGFGKYKILGETLDDALGEAFDKVARILNLGYPGGPVIENLAKQGDENAYPLPVPMVKSKDLNFSYSGLKTAVLYLVRNLKKKYGESLNKKIIADLCASFQKSAADSLVGKLETSVKRHKPKGILLGGGVICNLYLRKKIRQSMRKWQTPVFIPYSYNLLTDNAAMIGICAYYQAKRGDFVKNISSVDRLPNLSFS